MRRALVVGVVATVLAGACAGDEGSEPTVAPTTSRAVTTTSTTIASTPPTTSPGGPSMLPDQSVVDEARRQIADRYGYALDEVQVVRVEAVEWRDAALGCPVSEREYAPGPVPGYRIVLGRGDLEFHFHGAEGEAPFHCQFLD